MSLVMSAPSNVTSTAARRASFGPVMRPLPLLTREEQAIDGLLDFRQSQHHTGGEKIGVLVLQVRVDKAVCVGQDMLPNCL